MHIHNFQGIAQTFGRESRVPEGFQRCTNAHDLMEETPAHTPAHKTNCTLG